MLIWYQFKYTSNNLTRYCFGSVRMNKAVSNSTRCCSPYHYQNNPVSNYIWLFRSKTLDWRRFRVVRVPPLKTFWGTSRPMRSQHFELSTNQKPGFRPDYRCWSNLESTNLTPMCQLTYNRMALDYQWNAHWLPTKGRLTTNGISIDCQWNVNRLPMKCQLNSNGMPIEFQLKANWIPMECHLTTIGVSLICQWNVNWWAMECLLTTN